MSWLDILKWTCDVVTFVWCLRLLSVKLQPKFKWLGRELRNVRYRWSTDANDRTRLSATCTDAILKIGEMIEGCDNAPTNAVMSDIQALLRELSRNSSASEKRYRIDTVVEALSPLMFAFADQHQAHERALSGARAAATNSISENGVLALRDGERLFSLRQREGKTLRLYDLGENRYKLKIENVDSGEFVDSSANDASLESRSIESRRRWTTMSPHTTDGHSDVSEPVVLFPNSEDHHDDGDQ